MTAVLQLFLVGAIVFTPQDVPDLNNALPSGAGPNYRLADLDGNDQQDLILPHSVYFQHGGGFSTLRSAASPAAGKPAACDVWDDTLFLRLPGRLQKARWEGKTWNITADQPVSWPNPGNQMLLPVYTAAAGLRFERFLQDIDRDGAPEIVLPDEKGLRIFRQNKDGVYGESVLLEVFPPLQLAVLEDRQLWPPSERGVSFPARTMRCRYNLNGNTVSIFTREDRPAATTGTLARYRLKQFQIDCQTYNVEPDVQQHVSEPFPPHLQLVRLNDDHLLDVAGGRVLNSQASPLPMPVYETKVSTDGGKTFRTWRVTGYQPNQSFIDINHDGRADVVTESTTLFNGGIRETLGRFCTPSEIIHEVRCYLQNSAGGFSENPDVFGSFTIQLNEIPMQQGPMFRRYQAGDLVCLIGDFNSDGLNDALVQDRPSRLAVYNARPGGFEIAPAAAIEIPNLERFSVADYNGDGRPDVLVQCRADNKLETTLYLAGEGAL